MARRSAKAYRANGVVAAVGSVEDVSWRRRKPQEQKRSERTEYFFLPSVLKTVLFGTTGRYYTGFDSSREAEGSNLTI
jgi:hypothetical protein